LKSAELPHHLVELEEVPGRSGALAVQGRAVTEATTAP